jgi:nardilysin
MTPDANDRSSSSSSNTAVEGENSSVTEGPDLNPSKSPFDKKEYRQILLPNGLRVVLISDSVAMTQSYNHGGIFMEDEEDDDDDDDDDDEEEEDDVSSSGKRREDGDDDDKDGDDDDDDEGDESESEGHDRGLRNAAAAMVVGVGSMSDPPECQGLAHFLEHLLFMGSTKYPEENAYDAFMSKHGGSDNAYTELEYTVYHFDIAQEYLAKALDMFAQFFTSPLLLESSVERELNSIESEFQLVKNSDGSRCQHLMSHTCGYTPSDHPFAKFSWGNLESLQEAPKRKNVDPMVELRKFYDKVCMLYSKRFMAPSRLGSFSHTCLYSTIMRPTCDWC